MRVLQGARKVVVCGHRGPDGDAMGSALGWAEYLKGLGKSVAVIMPTPCPDVLQWLPGSNTVIYYDHKQKLVQSLFESADLVCCLDFNALNRLQDMAPVVERSKAPRLMIDHHLDPDTAMA